MENFTDLLTDAFSDTSVPSFPEEDLDFENLNFEEKFGADEAQSVPAEKDSSQLQEATGETTDLFADDDKYVLCLPENVRKELADERSDEEDFQGAGVGLRSTDKAQEEDYTSSEGEPEEEDSASGDNEEDEVEQPGDLSMSVCCTDEVYIREKEDRIFAEGQPLALQGADNPQVSNKEQGEAGSDEEVSYFGEVPEKDSEMMMMMKGASSEEDEQERGKEKQELPSDLETEGMKIRQEEEEVLTQRFKQEIKQCDDPDPHKASLEFPSLPLQNLQDLIIEVGVEECEEKMKEFSGEEHQEAGESFADYPSDFSSSEYVEDGGRNHESEGKVEASIGAPDCCPDVQQNTCLEIDVKDVTSCVENHDDTEAGCLFSRDLETDADELLSRNVADRDKDKWKTAYVELEESDGDEAGESDSYSSSEDEFTKRRSYKDFLDDKVQQDLEHKNQLEKSQFDGGSRTYFPRLGDDLMTNSRVNPTDFVNWDFDVLKKDTFLSECMLTAEDEDKTETPTSSVNQSPYEHVNSYSVVMREDTKTTSPSCQGSLDDSFFFNTGIETSGVTEVGQGNYDHEDERKWEQEQERIKAFFEYYDDSDEENEKEGRQVKVQFCPDPLSQVIRYETDSDADSLSSSTDREEDPSSADTPDEVGEPRDSQQINPERDPPTVQGSAPHLSNTQIRAGKHRCLSVLKLLLKLALVVVTGLLMYWLITDQADWLSQDFFF